MDRKDENSPSSLWTRRSNSSKLSLSMNKPERSDSRDSHDTPSAKRFGPPSSHGKNNPFNSAGPISTSSVSSPTAASGSSAFGLGSGAFASFGSSASKTPKTPGSAADFAKAAGAWGEKKEVAGAGRDEREKEQRRPPARKSLSSLKPAPVTAEAPAASAKDPSTPWPLKHSWVMHYRPPTSKNSDYEKSIQPICRISTAQDFWKVYAHLARPSLLPIVSDYHIFKDGIRPVWEDEENRRGGKWILRLKKGVADRYWEDVLLALIGDQFAETGEEVCGAVVSVRSGEDQISIWTKVGGGRHVKVREIIKRVLALPADTNVQWRSHDESITQRNAVDQAKHDKLQNDKRRSTVNADKSADEGKA